MRLKRLPSKPRICLALQGGGAHGAFTWGVLDFLLEASDLQFEGVSGTSAGAMNAVVLADGLMKGGRDGRARRWPNSGARSLPACPSRWRCAHSMAKV